MEAVLVCSSMRRRMVKKGMMEAGQLIGRLLRLNGLMGE
jgi:hypothetical protein